jgi:hypothetical protein
MRHVILAAALMIATPAMAGPPCGQAEYSMPGLDTCQGKPRKLPAGWENWDGCNGRAYDECGRHVWVHYRHWRKPPMVAG